MFVYENKWSDNEGMTNHFNFDLSFPSHLHRSMEFVYVEEGEMEVQIGGHRHTLGAGDCALVLPGQIHSYYTAKASYSYLCIFSCDYVYDFYSNVVGKFSPNPTFRLEDLSCIATLTTPGINRYLIKAMLYSIVGQFSSNCSLLNVEDLNEGNVLEKAIVYVQEHFCEPLSLKELAEALGYHYNYLSAYLNEQLGMHFSAFVNLYRIDYACDLLSHSDLAVTEIATRCGFDTVRSFNRNFLKVQNTTPQEYRRKRAATAQAVADGNSVTPPP